jgi:hypothetical protein
LVDGRGGQRRLAQPEGPDKQAKRAALVIGEPAAAPLEAQFSPVLAAVDAIASEAMWASGHRFSFPPA